MYLDQSDGGITAAVEAAEKYLLKVLHYDTRHENFDKLRSKLYTQGKKRLIAEFPPTSKSMHLHIKRALIATYMQLNILNKDCEQFDPTDFGYLDDGNGSLIPEKVTTLFPPIDLLPPNCTCVKCARRTCRCFASNIPCIEFCTCKINNTCTRT